VGDPSRAALSRVDICNADNDQTGLYVFNLLFDFVLYTWRPTVMITMVVTLSLPFARVSTRVNAVRRQRTLVQLTRCIDDVCVSQLLGLDCLSWRGPRS